jgi:hypothetical protein
MKKEEDIRQDIADIRSMMERSRRFLSLSGWSGIMAGVYALVGAYVAHTLLSFRPAYPPVPGTQEETRALLWLATTVLALAMSTALILSHLRARKQGERSWTPSTRRMVVQLAIPLVGGGLLIIALLPYGFLGLSPGLTLLFYGLALVSASPYTFSELRVLGILQVILGLLCATWIELSLLFWAMGFGVLHIAYGLYIYLKYQR